jgi:hypothetical protein
VICVAIVIAVGEVRPDFAQVAWSDRLIARHADGMPAGLPAVHQDESHVPPPEAKRQASTPPRKWFAEATETRFSAAVLPRLRSISLTEIVDMLSPAIGLFRLSSETRRIETDGSIVRR